MCGINGFSFADEKIIKRMNNMINHRGPDDEGSYVDENVSLGHVRLSIIDLSSAGHQPMFYSHKGHKVVIVFNGEIYNFHELKKRLIDKGYKFKSTSDTEVILASYLEYGYDCVKYLNGMWSFVIYDPKKKILFGSRDRVGIKPFYYFLDGKDFAFSSEMKGLKELKEFKEINRASLIEYLQSKSISFFSESMVQEVKTLHPGKKIIFNLKTRKADISYADDVYTYISKKKYLSNQKKPLKFLVSDLDKLMHRSVKRHMIADVEVATICSGGLDSSLITAIAKKYNENIHVYTVDTGESGTSELEFAETVTDHLGLNLRIIKINKKKFENLLDKVIGHLEYPLVHPNTIGIYLLLEGIIKDDIKVVLSGEGADELFGGYSFYLQFKLLSQIRSVFERLGIDKVGKLFQNHKFLTFFLALNSTFFNRQKLFEMMSYEDWPFRELGSGYHSYKNLLSDDYLKRVDNSYSFLKKGPRQAELFLNKDIREYLLPLLRRADKMGMAHGMEVRVPFLDQELINFSLNLPIQHKIKGFEQKFLLKKVAEKYLPKKIVYRKKYGFPLPIAKWYGSHEQVLRNRFVKVFEKNCMK